jgi:hypothetical protein
MHVFKLVLLYIAIVFFFEFSHKIINFNLFFLFFKAKSRHTFYELDNYSNDYLANNQDQYDLVEKYNQDDESFMKKFKNCLKKKIRE